MNATLFTFDATQWGALALGLLVAAVVYSVAYLSRKDEVSVAGVTFGREPEPSRRGTRVRNGGRSSALRHASKAIHATAHGAATDKSKAIGFLALISVACFAFCGSVFVSLSIMLKAPVPLFTDTNYSDEEELAINVLEGVVTKVIVAIEAYDGYSHARVRLNHRVVFDSNLHCRLVVQCLREEVEKHRTDQLANHDMFIGCITVQCKSIKRMDAVGMQFPYVEKASTTQRATSPCKKPITIEDSKTLTSCEFPRWMQQHPIAAVHWQSGITTDLNHIPLSRDVTTILQRGRNILEIASENTGVGTCNLSVRVSLEQSSGVSFEKVFTFVSSDLFMTARSALLPENLGQVMQRIDRRSYATCGRKRIAFYDSPI